MKNSEIRVGNLIQCIPSSRKSQDENDYGIIGKVLSIGNDDVEFEQIECECSESFEWFFKDDYTGIPLSEKWLRVLGLQEIIGKENIWEIGRLRISYVKTLSMCYLIEEDTEKCHYIKNIQYVHDLQNLFFALSCEELIHWDEIDIAEILNQIEE